MPESMMKQIKQQRRPTSDIIMEAEQSLLNQVEKSAVANSNKHVSMLLARSRSLDVLSSSSSSSPVIIQSDKFCKTSNDEVSSPDESPRSNKANGKFKDDSSSIASTSTSSSSPTQRKEPLLKEKSELNNNSNVNGNSENYRNSSNRSSSSSTNSNCSSNYSVNSKTDHNKVMRRSSSSTTEGVPSFTNVKIKEPIRITGYLEKRSKVLGWKKFWFVLDGRLLTYYKSKADYESLSACCGCINLGIASTVRPIQIRGCKGYPLQIVTRSQVYYLRSPEKPVLEQWLLAIQEAASSSPSSAALTSWNSCLGSQYFRQSFASQSQWSLNNSTEDITDISGRLGNLPDSFYQRRDKGSLIYPSPPTLSQRSPIIHKCHSFASLQLPVINNFGGTYGKRVLLSSTENLRDFEKESKSNGASPRSLTMQHQHSTSLLVLDSSPQAAELRKELTRKLSGGSSNNCPSQQPIPVNPDESSSDAPPTPKFLLFSSKKKSQGGDDESHHYAEIGDYVLGKKHYENCDAEHSPTTSERSNSDSKRNSLRGESAERESNIYEHVETGEPINETREASGIPEPPPLVWESLNDPSCNNIKRFPPHRMSGNSNRNSLVSISELPEDFSSTSPSPIKTPVLSSIPESSWRSGVEPFKSFNNNKTFSEDDLSSCRSESFRSLPCAEKISKKKKGKAALGFFAKMFGKNKSKGSKSDSQDNLHKPMVITGPVDLRKQVQMQELPPRRPPSYLQKKNALSKKKSDSIDVSNQQSEQDVAAKTSPTIPGSRMTINNTNVMDELKQKVGHITLKRTSSRSSSGSDNDLSIPKDSLKDKQKIPTQMEARVPYIPRPALAEIAKPVLVLQTQEKSESNTDDDIIELTKREKEIQTASICFTPDLETSCSETGTLPKTDVKLVPSSKKPAPPPPIPKKSGKIGKIAADDSPAAILEIKKEDPEDFPVTRRKQNGGTDSEMDFQNKLAKFNRLSRTLSANFMAALQPAHVNPMQTPMTRSNSYKTKKGKGEEVLPPLPPKKKNADGTISASMSTIPLYDVPSNNKPVNTKKEIHSPCTPDESEEKSIAAYIRDLTKKNSTPDIVISGNNNSKSICLRDVMTDSKEFRQTLNGGTNDNFDLHKSSPSISSSGRPPKPKPPAKPKSLDLGSCRVKRSSESSISSDSGSEVFHNLTPVTPSQTIIQPIGVNNKISSTTINKSSSGEKLNALSDVGVISNTVKIIESLPDSPKNCTLSQPGHEILDNNISYSANVRTPESMVSCSDNFVPDSLATTPDTELMFSSSSDNFQTMLGVRGMDSEVEPLSINKLEIVIRDNDGSPTLVPQTPDNESRIDSLERKSVKSVSVTPMSSEFIPPAIYQNIKFATVNTLIQEFETVEENEEEMSELYDDFPSEFYTPTPSSFSGYSPSDVSTTPSDTSPIAHSHPTNPSSIKKHARIDAIRNSGMEQLEAFLHYGSSPSSDDCSFESCIDSFSEDGSKISETSPSTIQVNNNNNASVSKISSLIPPPPQFNNGSQGIAPVDGNTRTGAISRLGHSSAVGHLQKILTSDVK